MLPMLTTLIYIVNITHDNIQGQKHWEMRWDELRNMKLIPRKEKFVNFFFLHGAELHRNYCKIKNRIHFDIVNNTTSYFKKNKSM